MACASSRRSWAQSKIFPGLRIPFGSSVALSLRSIASSSLHDVVEAKARETFECRYGERAAACRSEQGERCVERVDPKQHDVFASWLTCQSQASLGHHPERSLAPDQQLLEIEPAVVLGEPPILHETRAVGQHGLHAHDPTAGVAVTNDSNTTRVGGDVAPDLTRAFGGKIDGPSESVDRGLIVHTLGRGARSHDQRLSHHIHVAERTQSFERKDELTLHRHRTARQTRATSGRHHADLSFMAESQDFADFELRSGPHQGGRTRRKYARAVSAIDLEVHGVRAHAAWIEAALELVDESRARRLHHSWPLAF